jgi:1-acyl-sn-glycerol-3-phosphate acyltransferase
MATTDDRLRQDLPVRPVTPPPLFLLPRWRPPRLWRFAQWLTIPVLWLICRIRITGEVAAQYRAGPLILASNHISLFDPVVTSVVAGRRGLAPRVMATAGVFGAPIIGAFMRACGHLPVARGSDHVADAVPAAEAALQAGSVLFIYPEGRIGLDPGAWPERPKTGAARLALTTGVPVVPVSIWGSHEVIAYHGAGAMVRSLITCLWRRPIVRVHFGAPVDLSDLRLGAVGHARRAGERIMEAICVGLERLRVDEPAVPRRVDPTRPLSTARRFIRPDVGRRQSTEGQARTD